MALDSSLTGQEGLNSWKRLSMESYLESTRKTHGSDLSFFVILQRGDPRQRACAE